MAATIVLVLSCLVYGAAAGGSVGGRPTAPVPVVSPTAPVLPPAPSYLPPVKGVAGGRPSATLAGPAVPKPTGGRPAGPTVPAPTVQRPIASGTSAKRLGGSRPAPPVSPKASVSPSAPVKGVSGGRPGAPPAAPAVPVPSVPRPAGTVPKPITRPSHGYKHSSSRTVGSHAPY